MIYQWSINDLSDRLVRWCERMKWLNCWSCTTWNLTDSGQDTSGKAIVDHLEDDCDQQHRLVLRKNIGNRNVFCIIQYIPISSQWNKTTSEQSEESEPCPYWKIWKFLDDRFLGTRVLKQLSSLLYDVRTIWIFNPVIFSSNHSLRNRRKHWKPSRSKSPSPELPLWSYRWLPWPRFQGDWIPSDVPWKNVPTKQYRTYEESDLEDRHLKTWIVWGQACSLEGRREVCGYWCTKDVKEPALQIRPKHIKHHQRKKLHLPPLSPETKETALQMFFTRESKCFTQRLQILGPSTWGKFLKLSKMDTASQEFNVTITGFVTPRLNRQLVATSDAKIPFPFTNASAMIHWFHHRFLNVCWTFVVQDPLPPAIHGGHCHRSTCPRSIRPTCAIHGAMDCKPPPFGSKNT